MKPSHILLGIIGIVIFGWIVFPFTVVATQPVAKDDPIRIEYYYYPTCPVCLAKLVVVNSFISTHPEANVSLFQVLVGFNNTEYFESMNKLGFDNPTPPFLLFSKQTCYYALQDEAITLENIEEWYQSFQLMEGDCFEIPNTKIMPWVALGSGIVTGISPCIMLISSLLFTGISLEKRSKKPLLIGLGFASGVILLYICLGLAVLSVIDVLAKLFYDIRVKIAIAIPLCLLGLWYIIDAFNTKSIIFSTPDRYKSVFKEWISRQTFLYAFILGFVFSFLKIPCIGGVMIALFIGLSSNFLANLLSIIMYFVGLLIPLVVVMIIVLRLSSSEKFEQIRVKYRPWLRILTGLILIGLTIYTLLAG